MHAGNHKRAAQDIVVLVFQHIFYSSCLINYMLEISDEFDSLKQFFFVCAASITALLFVKVT